jgi:hypothetical protein
MSFGRGQPIQARQVDINDRDIRTVRQRLRNDVVPALDGGNHLHIGFQFDKRNQCTAHHGDVFCEQDPQREHAGLQNLLVMASCTGESPLGTCHLQAH